ncbi:MAG: O-antigen polysaccharide polymerase Wzy [Candidatus Berkelbacteria bacterium]
MMTANEKIKEQLGNLLPIHIVALLLTLTIFFFMASFNLSENNQLLLWQFLLITTFIWMIWSWVKLKKTFFNPYGLFLIAAFLFNFSWIILSFIPGNSVALLANYFPTNVVVMTIIVVDLSIMGLHLGALLAVTFFSRSKEKKALSIADENLIIVGYFLILVSIYPFFLTIKEAVSLSISSGYTSLYQLAPTTGLLAGPTILASFIIPGTLLLLAGSKKDRATRLISLLLVISIAVLQLVVGKRSTAIMPLVAYIWLWHKTIKPVNIIVISALSVLFLCLLFPIIRISRDISGIDKFSWQNISNSLSTTNPLLDTLNEMGSSIKTTAYTTQLIPLHRHWDLGTSYLYSLTTIMPNFFWKIHPAIQHGTLSDWLITTVDPVAAKNGLGLGYSFIAEAYANFGFYGSWIITMVIGIFFVSISEFAEIRKDKLYFAGLAAYLSFFLFFARGESVGIIRPFFWYSLLPIGLVLMINKYRAKKMSA